MTASGLQRMELVLDWIANVQFAGPCWAVAHGLYRDAGIDMALVPWEAEDRDIVAKTCARDVPAIGSSEDNLVIAAAARGAAPVAAMAAMFQTTPLVLMSQPAKPLERIADLRGKRVAIHCDGLHVLEGLMHLHDIAADDVEIVEVTNDLDNLTSGGFDAVQGYAVCEPQEHAARGLHPATLTLRHPSLHPYAQVMFAPTASIEAHAGLYRAALDATFAGWQAVLADPVGAARAIEAVGAPMADRALQAEALGQVGALVRGMGDDGRLGLGCIDPARWAANIAAYARVGLVPDTTAPDCALRADLWPSTQHQTQSGAAE